jgi:glycosyltransferase involved in cell wall biosynthesis
MWREECVKALDICDYIIVPYENNIEIWNKYYPQFAEKIKVIEHGHDNNTYAEVRYDGESNDIHFFVESIIREGNTYRISGWGRYVNKVDKAYLLISNTNNDDQLIMVNILERPDVDAMHDSFSFGFSELIPISILNENKLTIRITVESNGQNIVSIQYFETRKLDAVGDESLNIGFIGGISTDKGGEKIVEIIKKKKNGVHWFIFGNVGTPELAELKQKNLTKSGKYFPSQLPVLLKNNKIDVICILSIWPETYSFTLTEALLNNIPVIVTDIGALGARVKTLECGRIVSVENVVEETISAIDDFIAKKSSLIDIKNKLKAIRNKSVNEMNEEYYNLYSSLIKDVEYKEAVDYQLIAEGILNNIKINPNKSGDSVDYNELNRLREMLRIILNSGSYKLARKMSGLCFPGSTWLKKYLRKKNR